MDLTDYQNLIYKDLSEEYTQSSETANIAYQITSFFQNHDPKHHSHLSFSSFIEILGERPKHSRSLITALSYLSASRVPLLKICFEFFDENNQEFIPLEPREIHEAELTGTLVRPDTGEEIQSYENSVFIYYEPNELAKVLYNAKNR